MSKGERGFSETSQSEQALHGETRGGRRLWPWLLLSIAVLVFIGSRLYPRPVIGTDGVNHSAVGKALEGVQLEPLTGDAAPLGDADLQGKVALLNFWGPWCGPCGVEFPHLAELEAHFREHPDFRFISVSSNPNPREEEGLLESTKEFLRLNASQLPTYHDPTAATHLALMSGAELKGFAYPTTVLLSRDGKIAALWVGYRPGLERDMRQAVEDVLGQPQ